MEYANKYELAYQSDFELAIDNCRLKIKEQKSNGSNSPSLQYSINLFMLTKKTVNSYYDTK